MCTYCRNSGKGADICWICPPTCIWEEQWDGSITINVIECSANLTSHQPSSI